MAPRSDSTIAAEADRLENEMQGLSEAEANAVWDVYGPRGYPAAIGMIAGFKAARGLRMKLKQLDIIDAAIERLRTAATTAAQTAGDADVAKAIEALAQQLGGPVTTGTTMADSGTQSKAKAAPADLWRDTLQGDLQSDMVPR